MEPHQLSLFPEEASRMVSIKEASHRIGVSTASINNWLREGLLIRATKGFVSTDSLEKFATDQAGVHKLTSRANKQSKDYHNHEQLSSLICTAIRNGKDGREIASEYEQSLSESYRNREGIYFTPPEIVADMFQQTKGDVSNKSFLEPCCGGGAFVVAALERGFRPENIYAFDTDSNAVAITRHRVETLTGRKCDTIICGDFLLLNKTLNKKFDYIFTNPPWGKKIDKSQKEKWATVYHTGASLDSCAIFMAAALQLVKPGGILGFLLPEAFYNVANFADIRKKILEYNIIQIADYGKFGTLMTKAQSLILSNTQPQEDVVCQAGGIQYVRKQSDFTTLPKNIINFLTSNEDNDVISYLYSLPHLTLQGNAQWALGIVTGNNKSILKATCGTNDVPIYKGRDVTKNGLHHANCYISRDLSCCQQVADISYYIAPEKIVYRFINDSIICCVDRSQSYILNSANLFFVNDSFPLSNQQVADMLNSDLMTWIFQKIFHTHKVLRGDLEQLPLFSEYFTKYPLFSEENLLTYLHITKQNGTYRIKE